MSDRAIRSIAVLGGGITGLSAAAALARTLPAARVTVIETPEDPAALADRLPGSSTAIHRFHATIGLDEKALLRAEAVVPRLALRFEHWSRSGDPWLHVAGEHGAPLDRVPFHQLWVRARRERQARPYHCYAAAGVLAAAGKFVVPQADPRSPLATYDYGLRIDPPAYRAALAQHADRLRVERTQGGLRYVDRASEQRVKSLHLQDGRTIEADLYIDASGPRAPLLPSSRSFEPWSAWLPFDRVSLHSAASDAVSPIDTLRAGRSGWQWQAPLPHRTECGRLWCSDAEPSSTDADGVAIRPGRVTEPWIGNVLAIGDGAVALDPLHWLPLHLLHMQIARMLDLIPDRDSADVEIAEYNRRANEESDRARDFAALHYLRSGKIEGGIWRTLASVPPPPSLEHTLVQFDRRGRLPAYDEDSLDESAWRAAMLGLGVLPRATDPVADTLDSKSARERLEQIAEALARIPPQLPDFPSYLQRMRG